MLCVSHYRHRYYTDVLLMALSDAVSRSQSLRQAGDWYPSVCVCVCLCRCVCVCARVSVNLRTGNNRPPKYPPKSCSNKTLWVFCQEVWQAGPSVRACQSVFPLRCSCLKLNTVQYACKHSHLVRNNLKFP